MILESEPYPEITEKIVRIMEEKINRREPPKTIWLTDTVYCGRKKLFSMKSIEQARFDETAISKIWLGIIVGEALKGIGVASETPVEYGGAKGRIDILLETGEPLEVKMATNMYVAVSEYAESHIRQLSRYCLAVGSETGVLFHYIPGMPVSHMPAKRYRFNLDKVKWETDERLEILKKAVEDDNPYAIPPTWHSKNPDNWECKKCVFRRYCWE